VHPNAINNAGARNLIFRHPAFVQLSHFPFLLQQLLLAMNAAAVTAQVTIERTTRWHGMMIGTGLLWQALPTHAPPRVPTVSAISRSSSWRRRRVTQGPPDPELNAVP
jgi:hypothetical protein